jgi:hypothetical protein
MADAIVIKPADYVLLKVAAAATGYSVRAIQRKIQEGVWREGAEWKRAPDGHIMVSMEGYRKWVESAPASRSARRPSASHSLPPTANATVAR